MLASTFRPLTLTDLKPTVNFFSEVIGKSTKEPLYLALSIPPKIICPVEASGELR